MAYAPTFPVSSLADSLSWRLFVRAAALAAAILAVGCVTYAVEKYVVAPRHRFVENPAEIMMRSFGFAHFLIGWLFLASSPRLRGAAALARLTGCVAMGGLFCLAFAWGHALRNPLALIGFYSLFLIHDCGDQIRLYQRQTRNSAMQQASENLLAALRWFCTATYITTLAGLYLATGYWVRKNPALVDLNPLLPPFGWSLLAVITIGTGFRLVRLALAEYGQVRTFARAHGPLLAIQAAIFVILALGSLFGTLGLNLIILLHVTTWLVHVHQQLGGVRSPDRSLWSWLRRTPLGFVVLHATVAMAVLVLLALRVQVWERSGWFCTLFSASSFPYWTAFHIATGWWRGR